MARTEFLTPVGRLVQGGITLEDQKDDEGNIKRKADGTPDKQCFIAVAFRKDDPQFPNFYALMVATAKADFPHLFPNGQNQATHPQFAWKLQDGDGVDANGKSVADKPGFAGHWIVKMASQFLPKCYYEGKFDASQQIQNPEQVIKKGYYVRVSGTIAGNGVTPQEGKKKPGLFISANLVSLVAFGEEIVGGPDANKAFGAAPVGALPPGATTMPTMGAAAAPGAPGGLTPPPLPNAAPAPAPMPSAAPAGLPPAPGAAPMPGMPGLPPAPGVGLPAAPTPAAPQFQMTAAAQGATREQLHALNWTDEQLIQHGYMIRVS